MFSLPVAPSFEEIYRPYKTKLDAIPKEFNIYAAYNSVHNFSIPAWISTENVGFSDSEADAWFYTLPSDAVDTSVLLFYGAVVNFNFDVQIYNDAGTLLPGTLSAVPNGMIIKMRYTFDTTVPAGTKIKYRVSSTSLPKQDTKYLINTTVTYA